MTETSPIALVSLGQHSDKYLLPGVSRQYFFGISIQNPRALHFMEP